MIEMSTVELLGVLRARVVFAEHELRAAVVAACPGLHNTVQHRDGRPPWCETCWRTDRGLDVVP
jgi:hypothetical protein